MGTRNESPTAFMAVPVGLMLKAELHERGVVQREFAEAIGLSVRQMSELLRGQRGITSEIAVKIERELGLPASALMAMQERYERDLEVISRRGVGDALVEQGRTEKKQEFLCVNAQKSVYDRP